MAETSLGPKSIFEAPPALPLHRLPVEIISLIFEQLTGTRQDIARLRLVCKLFAEIGNLYLLDEVHLFNKSSQFDQLRQISEHPTISKKVETLFYEADILTKYDRMQDWKKAICVPRWMRSPSPEPIQLPSPTASPRELRAYNRSLNKTMHGTLSETLLRRAYDSYTGFLADQESMVLQDYNMELLKNAMMKMPNLKSIEMSTECCLYSGRSTGMEQAFKDGLSAPYGDRQTQEGCGVGQLRALLLAADAAGLKLETLAAGNLDWRFFQESDKQNMEVFRKIRGSMRSLRTLKLYVSTLSEDDDYNDFEDLSHAMVPECASYLRETSHLKDFVTTTPDLERLDISFDCDVPYPPTTLCDCIGTFKWHSLRVAAFAYISADEECLVEFFHRHACTLRKLRLDTILLSTGSWPSLLKGARQTLKLEQAALSGRMRSLDPEECFYFDLPPGLNGGKRAKIEVIVENYLLGKTDGPLLLNLQYLMEKYCGRYVYPEDLSDYVDTESDEFIMDRF